MSWWQMGGYAQYVWPSYGLAIAAVLLNIYWARRSHAREREAARRRLTMSREDA